MKAKHSWWCLTSAIAMVMAICVISPLIAQEEAAVPPAELCVKPRVAVVQAQAAGTGLCGHVPADRIVDMLIAALVKTGEYSVMDRTQLKAILEEKGMSESDLFKSGIATDKKLSVADILMKPSLSANCTKDDHTFKTPLGYGGWGVEKATVALDVIVTFVGTGEVLSAVHGDGEDKHKTIVAGVDDYEFVKSSEFNEEHTYKASQKAIDSAVPMLESKTQAAPWTGALICKPKEDTLLTIYINAGSNICVAPGMLFEVSRVVDMIEDPVTGEILERITETVGVVRAVKPLEKITTVEVVEGEGFQTGDMVKLKK